MDQKLEKGKQEWKNACGKKGLYAQKFKTPMKIEFASKGIMFDQLLKFKEGILLCYGRKGTITLQQKVLNVEVWGIAKAFTNVLNCVVTTYVMN